MARRRAGIHFSPPIYKIAEGSKSAVADLEVRASKLAELVAKLEEQLKDM